MRTARTGYLFTRIRIHDGRGDEGGSRQARYRCRHPVDILERPDLNEIIEFCLLPCLTIFLGLETLGLIAVGQCLPQGGR